MGKLVNLRLGKFTDLFGLPAQVHACVRFACLFPDICPLSAAVVMVNVCTLNIRVHTAVFAGLLAQLGPLSISVYSGVVSIFSDEENEYKYLIYRKDCLCVYVFV